MPRFNIEFSEDAAAALLAAAKRSGTTKAEVIRKALSLEKWFYETIKSGSKIIVETDGKLREVLPL